MVASDKYTQLHKDNVYIDGEYCIEKADLIDDESVVMIKDQHQQADLVYLVKQATTSSLYEPLKLKHSNIVSLRITNHK